MKSSVPSRIKLALRLEWESRAYWRNPFSTFIFFLGVRGELPNRDRLSTFHLGGMEFLARCKDWYAVEEVILRHEYAFVRSLFRDGPPSTVIDLGANIGTFSLYLLSLWPQAVVHAVEPSEATFQVLERNRRANPGFKWHVYRYALSDANGQVALEDTVHSTSARIRAGRGSQLVPAITLATLLNQIEGRIDLLKADIEGSEEAAFCGNEGLLERVDYLVLELHRQYCNAERVTATLRAAFDHLYSIPGRASSKPLLVACRHQHDLPRY